MMSVVEIVDFVSDAKSYRDLCTEMKAVLSLEKEVAAKKEELRKKILEQSQGERMEWGIKVSKVTPKGSVDYKGWLQSMYAEEQFEEVSEGWRKESSESWRIVSY